ncbi:hypothetical protein GJAV_G00205540 [Gymnothorax javanicus]|nr:hypothetical protein GJAV_G00205540 [Gymnothorax javanicus]
MSREHRCPRWPWLVTDTRCPGNPLSHAPQEKEEKKKGHSKQNCLSITEAAHYAPEPTLCINTQKSIKGSMPHDDMDKPLLPGSGDPERLVCDASCSPSVGILGSGDFARSLAVRLTGSGRPVLVGSRNPKRRTALFPPEAEVTTQEDAAARSDLLFVALFPEHFSTLTGLQGALRGKVLVDVSNASELNRGVPSNAEQLARLFPDSHVVKGFNVISAWALLAGPRDGSRQIPICSDSCQAKSTVMQLCRSLGFVPVDAGALYEARRVEDAPLRLFPSWGGPLLCGLGLFFIFYTYNFVRGVLLPYAVKGENLFYRMPVELVNVSLPAVALEMLALVYLPGLLAAALQLQRGTKYSRFPSWLDRWLCLRKQLGLLSWGCSTACASFSHLSLPPREVRELSTTDPCVLLVRFGGYISPYVFVSDA